MYTSNSCSNKHIDEEVLYKAFISSFNALTENKEHFLDKLKVEDGDDLRKYTAKEFLRIIENGVEIEKFDLELYFKMTEKMTVFENERITVKFLDGIEVECIIE